MNNDNLLECKLCGKKCKSLLRHVSGKHKDITLDEYKRIDPRDRYTCDETSEKLGAKLSERNKESWKNEEYRDRMTQYHSEKFKELWQRDSFREHVTQSAIDRADDLHQRMWNDPEYVAKMKSIGHETMTKLWSDPEFAELVKESSSDNIKKLYNEGVITKDMCIYNSRSMKRTLKYKDGTYRSSWEVYFVKYLESRNIDFEYEMYEIKYTYDNEERSYYPDFFLPKYNLFIEIHPRCLLSDRMKAKISAVDHIEVLTEDELFSNEYLDKLLSI
jgi:hypothetical protein